MGVPRKRPMRRKPERARTEVKKSHVVAHQKMVKRLRDTVYRRNDRIKVLDSRIAELKLELETKEHKLGVIHRRELRKAETKLRKSEEKYKKFQERKGIRHRTIIHRKKFVTYEAPTKIKNFEKYCKDLNSTLHENHITQFERTVKLLEFLSKYNANNSDLKHQLTINHYLVLLNLAIVKVGLGITSPNIIIPTLTPHIIRKILVQLLELGFADKNKLKYRITLLGQEFLKEVKNFDSYGKSEVVEVIKRVTKI